MFGWLKKRETSKEELEIAFTLPLPSVKAGTSFLGPTLIISGNITGEDDVQLHGRHEGTIDLHANLEIRKSAVVNGSIAARSISVRGSVEGDLRARKKLLVERSARVSGTVTTPTASVEEGAFLEGKVEMDGSG